MGINSIEDVQTVTNLPILSEKSVDSFSKQMEKFFFLQFSYYSLKWTQKSSQKDSNELLEASASWKTYFKSIFLESKDSNLKYGSQERKIFQILLGLELTYPINRLQIRQDMKVSEKARQLDLNQSRKVSNGLTSNTLEEGILALDMKMKQLRNSKIGENISEIYSLNYEKYIEKISEISKNNVREQSELNRFYAEINVLDNEVRKFDQELSSVQKNILKITRSISDLQEFIAIGRLFSNLEIKYCPCCNKKVSNQSTSIKNKELECILCHEIVDADKENINQKYTAKIEYYTHEKMNLVSRKIDLETLLEDLKKQCQTKKNYINHSEAKIKSYLHDISALQEELESLKNLIKQQGNKPFNENEQLEQLIAQKAVMKFQLNQLGHDLVEINDELLSNQINLLDFAIKFLKSERYKLGNNILNDLSLLMLEELHLFGLNSITEIRISEDFNISYKQNGDFVPFERIAEGEQLRVKISLYLSLVQLDIKYSFGKHTRFLILDSPSKEEGDLQFIGGLSSLLKSIEERFKGDLQILIGTAERRLSGIVANEILLSDGEFLF